MYVVDDIVVFGHDEEDHDNKLRLLLKMNRNKCEFRLDEINFVGHRVTSDGLKPDERNIEAILKMEIPTDVKGIQRLQGTVGYLSRFLPGLSIAVEPIRRLTQPDVPWKWTKEQDEAMTQVKKLTTQSPVLACRAS